MRILLKLLAAALCAAGCSSLESAPELSALLDRVGGEGASGRIVAVVNPGLSSDGEEVFVIDRKGGKPYVEGSSLSAASAGIGWYLNHYAGINLHWNCLTTDLADVELPLPDKPERRKTSAGMRYYLNYCTFSYTMAFWDWDRWEKEIDWMALRGINMPLVIVGVDCVWKNILGELGYDKEEINGFVAGPGFQAWWLMGNLQGWGGPNPDWWYEREERLAGRILSRMRSLGMEPVLPGYGGMLPGNAKEKLGWETVCQGKWFGFERPAFQLPSSPDFRRMSELYYRHLDSVMGKSKFYSMDLFHEGNLPEDTDIGECYRIVDEALQASEPGAGWVIQAWGSNPCAQALSSVPRGDFIVLDLFSDGNPRWMNHNFQGHDWVFCMLHNFGGRTGIHGRLESMTGQYFNACHKEPESLKGVGITAEGIETNPVLYDALMELPWMDESECDGWLARWVKARYGVENDNLLEGWRKIASSALDCRTGQQGTSEPIVCARPSLEVDRVSTWGTSALYYDPSELEEALACLEAGAGSVRSEVGLSNYRYDCADLRRQVLSNACIPLLAQVKAAYDKGDMDRYESLYNEFLDDLLALDTLLASEPQMTYDYHAAMAEAVCDEVEGATESDREWMLRNLRTQITVWGPETAASLGLRDYSNREWSGMLRNYCHPRWKRFFECLRDGRPVPSGHEWFEMENGGAPGNYKDYK
ncbi:MAG: alpha-N-acetylglucosaminidase [Bacteroidales bacterium]|nr:alpha-N-acetylglucosaminidase [Bacteroidales bacterium]